MPAFDSYLFNKKGEKKILKLTLSDGEDIHDCIAKGMSENKLKEVVVESIEGRVKEGQINYFVGNKHTTKQLKNEPIVRAYGNFKLNVGQLWGNIHVVINARHPTTGSLARGKAADGVVIDLSFVEMKD